MQCPKCCGTNVSNNKINTRSAGPGRQLAAGGGHPIVAAGILAIQAAAMCINAFSHKYYCKDCGHEFSS